MSPQDGNFDEVSEDITATTPVFTEETEADMITGESSGYLQEQIAKAMPTLARPPITEHYEVQV